MYIEFSWFGTHPSRSLAKSKRWRALSPHTLYSWCLSACNPLLISLCPAWSPLPYPLGHLIYTHIRGCYSHWPAVTPELYVSPPRSSLHCTEECPVGGAEALQRLRVWNKPGFLLPRPAPPSNLSPWMAPSFARLHIQTPECLPPLLPPIYCLGSTHLASVVLPSAHA